MRVVVCDYSGHPFQVQLARELACRGHEVLHLHFAEFQTPKGRLEKDSKDPKSLQLESISLGQPFAKHTLVRRWVQERAVGRMIADRIEVFKPDVVLASNLPLDSLAAVVKRCRAEGIPFVFWQQDIYSKAIGGILTRRLGPVGLLLGIYYRQMERKALQQSAAIIVISADFVDELKKTFGIRDEKLHVIENWAPLNEIVPRPKSNMWSQHYNPDGKDLVLYTGTIGFKHDPSHILAAAQRLRLRQNTMIVVASEGPGAEWLADEARRLALFDLKVIPFQPYNIYSEILGSADILVAILEPNSGVFSVPSKILSYLCAGRPIVIAAPSENLASKIVVKSGGGISVPAGRYDQLGNTIAELLDNRPLRASMAKSSRAYAESVFDITKIGTSFEVILTKVSRSLCLES